MQYTQKGGLREERPPLNMLLGLRCKFQTALPKMEIIIVQILMYTDLMELSSNKYAALCTHSFSPSLCYVLSHLLVFRGIMQVSLIDHKWAEDESS